MLKRIDADDMTPEFFAAMAEAFLTDGAVETTEIGGNSVVFVKRGGFDNPAYCDYWLGVHMKNFLICSTDINASRFVSDYFGQLSTQSRDKLQMLLAGFNAAVKERQDLPQADEFPRLRVPV